MRNSSIIEKQVILIAFTTSLLGCISNDDLLEPEADSLPDIAQKDVRVQNGRLVFQDMTSFFNTIESIHGMDEEEVEDWKSRYSFMSLGDFLDSEPTDDMLTEYEGLDKLPFAYYILLNQKAEVQIGDEIVWYNKGTKYFAPDEAKLRALRENPALSEKSANYFFNKHQVGEPGEENGIQQILIGVGAKTSYQKETVRCSGSGYRKHVFELNSFMDGVVEVWDPFFGPGYTYHSVLFIDAKLEQRSGTSGSWHTTTDYRYIEYAFTSNVVFHSNAGPSLPAVATWATGQSPIERRSNYQMVLFEAFATDFYVYGSSYYDVSVNGWLYQAQSTTPTASGGGHCNGFAKGGISGIVW